MKGFVIAIRCACILLIGLPGHTIAAQKMSREQARKECLAQSPGHRPKLAQIHHQCIIEKMQGK